MILLDTNVISELARSQPHAAVLAYVGSLAPETVFTAAVCEAEIRYGLARMTDGRRRHELIARMRSFFEIGFPDQVLRFDRTCAAVYGEIRHAREAAGKPITVEDAMIAATARAYGVQAIATRNTKDFVDCGVTLIDPWLTPNVSAPGLGNI
jgi:predicted nucleic acid-binding protein